MLLSDYAKSLSDPERRRYHIKVAKCGSDDPLALSDDQFTNDVDDACTSPEQLTHENSKTQDATGAHAGFGRRDVVEHLLQNGANVHAKDDGGLIPLHNACSFGHAEVVQLLLKHAADPNARDNWNYTPLHEAAIKGKVDVCIVLLQHGADASIRNTDGKIPLDLADPSTRSVLTGDYRKDELLESARSGNEEKLLSLLTSINVNCHASDGRKVIS
ncbi:hypothetical protein HPB52_005280 [Rhipicephalus sanguineus]|uniref:Uncharacterized protein n=1 Tax=Rhipicephalus sanguineus TaxID=34632 RepID=A0A9D4QHL3_RHISA|nr:hypothetical protein HPB52_005280 [Rhipicephalus sanguineus]